ncbi:MAG: hypothetical protein M1831_003448 [Alyxoria varia]|nr:MAG: hypothetical protein M1831_003448 [Alyxoria varia]
MALVPSSQDDRTPKEPWERAKERFLDGLSDHEKELFRTASLENALYGASNASRWHLYKSKSRRVQKKLEPLRRSLEDYGRAMDVFSNTSSLFLCPIWGCIRMLLAFSNASERQFEAIVDMLNAIGDPLPRFRSYEVLFPDDFRLMNQLTDNYLNVLKFCGEVKNEFTTSRGLQHIIAIGDRAVFQSRIKQLVEDLHKQKGDIERQALVAFMSNHKKIQDLQTDGQDAAKKDRLIRLLADF